MPTSSPTRCARRTRQGSRRRASEAETGRKRASTMVNVAAGRSVALLGFAGGLGVGSALVALLDRAGYNSETGAAGIRLPQVIMV